MCLLFLAGLFFVAGIERIIKRERSAVALGVFYVLCGLGIVGLLVYGTLAPPPPTTQMPGNELLKWKVSSP